MNAITTTIKISQIESDSNYADLFNQEVANSESDFICIIDDKNTKVELKDSCLDLMQMAMHNNPLAGMLYADYEIKDDTNICEIHLLKHHIGRVRDNQDYGKVFLFRKSYLNQINGFIKKFKHNFLYDIRLRLSEISEFMYWYIKSDISKSY